MRRARLTFLPANYSRRFLTVSIAFTPHGLSGAYFMTVRILHSDEGSRKWPNALVVEKRRSCMKPVFPYVPRASMNEKERDVLGNSSSRTSETRMKPSSSGPWAERRVAPKNREYSVSSLPTPECDKPQHQAYGRPGSGLRHSPHRLMIVDRDIVRTGVVKVRTSAVGHTQEETRRIRRYYKTLRAAAGGARQAVADEENLPPKRRDCGGCSVRDVGYKDPDQHACDKGRRT